MSKFQLAYGIPATEPPNFDDGTKWLICANQLATRCVIVKDNGKCEAFDQHGNAITKINALLDLFACLPDGLVFDGGIVNHKSEESFQFHVIDCLTIDEFNGKTESPVLSERLERLKETADALLLFKNVIGGFEHLYFAPHLIADLGVFTAMHAGMEIAGWKGIVLRKDVPYRSGKMTYRNIQQEDVGRRLLLTDRHTGIPLIEAVVLEVSPNEEAVKIENKASLTCYWEYTSSCRVICELDKKETP
jgi:hypothetical protein